ncbi:DNA/RNA non-specific endonuclease [Campylobacter novaezeelandiae]|uniref:DNA/RNA non-specific endonuclease n=1 Tax=Campylobacter novaezeelandiae TaxID=2267891 RepID=UPI001037EBED|nr:DNA/RNA non-specific endonuclease [Campylobacter novaezeelandiae]TBR81168.1 DNA/RNA non-specific endonuclease [Campylobacter novaezeelandiae]
MKKSIIILFCIFGLTFANDRYIPSKEFKEYFNNEDCSLVLDKFYYLNCYDYGYKGTKAVAYRVEASNLKAVQLKNRPYFEEDTNIPKKYRTYWQDYKKSGYTRGHTAPNASFRFSVAAQKSVFLMSNITPQNAQINNKVWNKIEKRERQLALKNGSIEVLNLVIYQDNPKFIRNNIAIPSHYIKILKTNSYKECYQIPNQNVEDEKIKNYKIDCKIF